MPFSPRQTVASSLIASLGYSSDAVLEIQFTTGAIYRYFTVPRSVYASFLAAQSKGLFFNRHIKPRFPSQRCDE